jgi:hypothetical protein
VPALDWLRTYRRRLVLLTGVILLVARVILLGPLADQPANAERAAAMPTLACSP